MQLKYESEISSLNPAADEWKKYAGIDNKKSFRWVFGDLSDKRNFSPRYADPFILDLARKRNKESFEGWALSFFDTQGNAKDGLKYFTKDKKEMYKKLGTHIAEGEINSLDGLTEIHCNEYGHFNHFEYQDTNFYNERFIIVEPVEKSA